MSLQTCVSKEVKMSRNGIGKSVKVVQYNRVFEANDFQGSYVVYGASAHFLTPFACDVQIQTLQESDNKQLRAHRLLRRQAGKKVPPLPQDALHDELLVIFGPEISPNEAVLVLRKLARHIERKGMLIGREKADGNFVTEQTDGSIAIC
jgi:hypothetical protein